MPCSLGPTLRNDMEKHLEKMKDFRSNKSGAGYKAGRALLGIVSGGAALLLSACGGGGDAGARTSGPDLPTVAVRVAPVEERDLPILIEVSGVARSSQRASVAPKVMGTISEFPVALGQSVKQGELLVKIDAAEIMARVMQAETQLSQARRDLQRERSLLEKGASTAEIVNNLQDRVTLMEARVEEAEVMRGYTEIRAPFDGRVARKLSDAGSLAAPGAPLLELEGSGGFEIEAAIPESLARGLTLGAGFSVELPSSQSRFEATLTEVSSGIDAASRSVTARFAVPEGVAARAGQFAKLTVEGPVHRRLMAPLSAVSSFGQMQRVFVAREGKAQLRLVKTGAQREGTVEIVSGLDAEESVVVESDQTLRDGQPLEIRP